MTKWQKRCNVEVFKICAKHQHTRNLTYYLHNAQNLYVCVCVCEVSWLYIIWYVYFLFVHTKLSTLDFYTPIKRFYSLFCSCFCSPFCYYFCSRIFLSLYHLFNSLLTWLIHADFAACDLRNKLDLSSNYNVSLTT